MGTPTPCDQLPNCTSPVGGCYVRCTGNPDPCSKYSGPGAYCSAQTGCYIQPGNPGNMDVCLGVPQACETFFSDFTCIGGCKWGCVSDTQPACSTLSVGICTQEPGCFVGSATDN
jgi:hypothetical protein